MNPASTAKLNDKTLGELGIDTKQVTLVGKKEFEDAFSDSAWLRVMNANYPRDDGDKWSSHHLHDVRGSSKFSESLVQLLKQCAEPRTRSDATKPELGLALAGSCHPSEIPSSIVAAFAAVRHIAKLE